jgi:phosphatidate cytidylyltransferase
MAPAKSQLWQRFLSAALLIPVIFVIIWFGPLWLFSLTVAIVVLLGISEFYRLGSKAGWQPFIFFGAFWTLFLTLDGLFRDSTTVTILVGAALASSLIWLFYHSRAERSPGNWLWTVGGIFYLGWTLSHFIPLWDLANGKEWVIFALFTTFAVDTSAYFVGRAWGRRPMALRISPGKSWEGAIGGVSGGVAAALILNLILGLPIGYGEAALLGFLVAIVAQIGDLVESVLKRSTGVKESGSLIPGHGGILDRLDSILFTVVLVYYYVVWFIV